MAFGTQAKPALRVEIKKASRGGEAEYWPTTFYGEDDESVKENAKWYWVSSD
jgi:hypothetical protein